MSRKIQPLVFGLLILSLLGVWWFTSALKLAHAAADTGAVKTAAIHLPGAVTLPDGLQYKDERVGTGAVARPGNRVTVNYTGWLANGQKFDSSLDHGQPFTFPLGAGQVIPGWDQGVAGMRVGGRRTLIIPPALGYGAQGAGGVIPPNATLKFTVDLLKVQ